MTIYEAIASGKRYRRIDSIREYWAYGGLMRCDTCIKTNECHIDPLDNTVYKCSGFQVLSTLATLALTEEDMIENYWITEMTESDFESEAESIINKLGLKIDKGITVK